MTLACVVRSAPWLAALVVGVLSPAACGGGDAGRGPSYTKIDDMEGPGPVFQWVSPPGTMSGIWFTSTDCTQFDRISPPPSYLDPDGWSYAPLPALHETWPGTTSAHALRFRTTSPLTDIWGANVGLAFATLPGEGGMVGPIDAGVFTDDAGICRQGTESDFPNPSVDLTAYSGVTFWARAESPGARALRVQVNDVNTDPRGGICQDRDSSASDFCYNAFGVQIELTDTFRQYTLNFSTFTQRGGWGYHPPDGIDWSRVYVMSFQMDLPTCTTTATSMCPGGPPALSFDIWLDDLYFVNK